MQPNMPFTAPQAPSAGDGIKRPSLTTIGLGRLCIFVPKTYEKREITMEGPKKGQMEDVVTCDVIVCDGGPVYFGGDPEEGKPHTHVMQVPGVISGMWIRGWAITDQLIKAIEAEKEAAFKAQRPTGQPVILGRLGKRPNPKGKSSWEIAQEGQEILATYGPIAWPHWQAYQAGQMRMSFSELAAQQPTPAYQASVGYPQVQQQFNAGQSVAQPWNAGQPVQNAAPQWPQAQPGVVAQPMTYPQVQQIPPQGMQPVSPAPGTPQPWSQPDPWQNQQPQQQQVAPVIQAQPMPAPVIAPTAPLGDWTLPYGPQFGFDATQWAQAYSQEQRATYLAQQNIHPPVGASPGI